MRKKVSRGLALLLAASMLILAMAACAGTPSKESGTPSAAPVSEDPESGQATAGQTEAEAYKIGFMPFDTTTQLHIDEVKYLTYLCDSLGWELQVATAATTDDAVGATENLIAAGCDAIIAGVVTDANIEKCLSICEEEGVYLALTMNTVTDEALWDTVSQNEYFLGAVAEDEYEAGYRMCEYLHTTFGAEKFALCNFVAGVNSATDLRWNGWVDYLAEHNLEAVVESRSGANDLQEDVLNTIALKDNYDALCIVGIGVEFAGQTLIDVNPDHSSIVVATCDIGTGTREVLDAGAMQLILGGQFGDPVCSFCLVYAALTGSPCREADGSAPNISFPYIELTSVEDFDHYGAYVCDPDAGVYAWSAEEVTSLCGPGVTPADIQGLADSYVLSEIVEKKAGS